MSEKRLKNLTNTINCIDEHKTGVSSSLHKKVQKRSLTKLYKFNRNGSLKGKTLFITGASRGIGLAIALAAGADGANVCVVAKTVKPHPRLKGTIYTAAKDIENVGGNALAVQCDIRKEEEVLNAVKKCIDKFGGIDILVNNASAISLTGISDTKMKRYDLMHSVNGRGTFLVAKCCLPYLKKSKNPHILTLSPPLNMEVKWFQNHVAYTMSKYCMSMVTLGLSGELKDDGIAVNSLWPRTTIATAAVKNLLGGAEMMSTSRTPKIMGDAAHAILIQDSTKFSGNYFIDDDVMNSMGIHDLDDYTVVKNTPETSLSMDFFVDPHKLTTTA